MEQNEFNKELERVALLLKKQKEQRDRERKIAYQRAKRERKRAEETK